LNPDSSALTASAGYGTLAVITCSAGRGFVAMPIINTALAQLIILIIIGVIVSLFFRQFGQTWFRRTIGGTTHTTLTAALVGNAGSFIDFHIGVVLELIPLPLMQYVLAIGGLKNKPFWATRAL
jgi:hypothetical protein